MAKIVLDIPKNKIQTLLNALIPLGINTNAILHIGKKNPGNTQMKKRTPRFLLNWEFFSNELEYE